MPKLYSQPFNQFIDASKEYAFIHKLSQLVIGDLKLKRIRSESYYEAVRLIILNLFTAYEEDTNKVVGISRDSNYWDGRNKVYNNPKLSYSFIVTSLDVLLKHKYIAQIEKGKQGFGDKHGITTRYRADKKLITLFKKEKLDIVDISVSENFPVIRLRGKKPKRTIFNPFPKGKLISFKTTPKIKIMQAMVREINNHLAMTDINLYLSHQEEAQLNKHMKANRKIDEAKEDRVRYHNKYLYRVFNESFDYGGRFYGGFWQQIPKEYRQRITIDNYLTFEMDYSAIHFSMLYQQVGISKEEYQDPYTLDVEDSSLRKVIKKTMNIMLNTSSFDEALNVCRKDKMLLPRKHYKNWTQLLTQILECHKPIKKFFFKQIGTELQRLDSDIAEFVMLKMINQHGAIVLPIHDSFICRMKDLGDLIPIMHEAAEEVAGLSLYMEPKVFKKNHKGYGDDLKINNTNYYKRRKAFLNKMKVKVMITPPKIV